jgi:hypothetical protein
MLKDHGFKSMAERDPEGMVRVLCGIGWDVPITVTLERKGVTLRYEVDDLLRVEWEGEEVLFHFEAESNFKTIRGTVALKRATGVGLLWGMDMVPVLVLYDPKRPAVGFDPEQQIVMGRVRVIVDFLIARLWEIKPDDILNRDRIHMLPLVAAMDSTPEQIHSAAMRIELLDSEEERRRLRGEMAVFASVRYNEAEIVKFGIGSTLTAMLPPIDIVRETEIGRRIADVAHFAGKQEGLQKGKSEMLAMLLSMRFGIKVPENALPTDEARIADLVALALAGDAPQVRRALGMPDPG